MHSQWEAIQFSLMPKCPLPAPHPLPLSLLTIFNKPTEAQSAGEIGQVVIPLNLIASVVCGQKCLFHLCFMREVSKGHTHTNT